MTDSSNEALAKALIDQQGQIGKLTDLLNSLSSVRAAQEVELASLQQQHLGVRTALQVFAELVMAASPEIKQMVASSVSQTLSRPEAANNQSLREILTALETAAKSVSRTTPEGRRANFQVVPSEVPPSET